MIHVTGTFCVDMVYLGLRRKKSSAMRRVLCVCVCGVRCDSYYSHDKFKSNLNKLNVWFAQIGTSCNSLNAISHYDSTILVHEFNILDSVLAVFFILFHSCRDRE